MEVTTRSVFQNKQEAQCWSVHYDNDDNYIGGGGCDGDDNNNGDGKNDTDLQNWQGR